MNKFVLLAFAPCLSVLTVLIFALDEWLGIVAYQLRFLLFCALVAAAFAAVWSAVFRKHALAVGLFVFLVLAAHVVLPAPSARLLRSVMLSVPPGTDADTIAGVVEEAYQGSSHATPPVVRDHAGGRERVSVSLASVERGNSTSLLFILDDGVVDRRIFSPD